MRHVFIFSCCDSQNIAHSYRSSPSPSVSPTGSGGRPSFLVVSTYSPSATAATSSSSGRPAQSSGQRQRHRPRPINGGGLVASGDHRDQDSPSYSSPRSSCGTAQGFFRSHSPNSPHASACPSSPSPMLGAVLGSPAHHPYPLVPSVVSMGVPYMHEAPLMSHGSSQLASSSSKGRWVPIMYVLCGLVGSCV